MDKAETTAEPLKTLFEKKSDRVALVAKVTPDKLKLFLSASPVTAPPAKPSTKPATEPEAQAAAPAQTVPLTLDDLTAMIGNQIAENALSIDVLKDIVANLNAGKSVEQRRIAKGTPAKPGRDGKLLTLVKPYNNPKSGEAIDFVDSTCFRFFDNIEKGNAVARLYPPAIGVDGVDVQGNPIKAAVGKPAAVKLDKSVTLVPAAEGAPFSTIIAETSGYLTVEKGLLTVKHELCLDGVDLKSGDIDFIGTVKVKGAVGKDFTVKSREAIEIDGDVQCATVRSATGQVRVKGAVTGSIPVTLPSGEVPSFATARELAQKCGIGIYSGQAFYGSVLTSVCVESFSNVEVEREAANCFIHTRGVLRMPTGNLLGGHTFTVCGVEAKSIGTTLGSPTVIIICSDIESSSDYAKLVSQITQHANAEELIRMQLGPYAENPARISLLNKQLAQKMEQLLKKLKNLSTSKEQLVNKQQDLLKQAHTNPITRVSFHEIIHQGVVIQAGTLQYVVAADIKGPGSIEYRAAENVFEVVELRPLECILDQLDAEKKAQEEPSKVESVPDEKAQSADAVSGNSSEAKP